ncbi:type II toxin-antitoxin system RelE/ParE family toxin [Azospirillum doebereinerae]
MADIRHAVLERREYAGRHSAARLLSTIEDAVTLLRQRPDIGTQRTDLTAQPVRFWPVERFWIVYTARPFQVVRFLGARRDVAALLG